MLEDLKKIVWECNIALPKNNLVTSTSGNASGRDKATGLIVIKPSGVNFDKLTPDDLVVVDPDGQVIEGNLAPSTDTASHLYIYNKRPDVGGVIHTHSNYATAFAALGQPIPCCLTAIADEFGGEIPCGSYARIGGEEIGTEILRAIGDSPAILMKQHGVFTIGSTPAAALKAAIMTEDVAKTVWLAMQIGMPVSLSEEEIAQNYNRYQHRYGQV